MSMTTDDVLAAPKPRRLSAAEVERLATLDPTNRLTVGVLRALRERITDPTDPALPLLDALEAVAARALPAAPPPAYVNPAKVSALPATAGDKRPLTPADIEWLKRLPAEPDKVSADDVAALARMVHESASVSDLQLLKSYFEPIWNHHDTLEQQHQRRVDRQAAEAKKGNRSRTVEQLAVAALTPLIQQQLPELRDHEARNRAAEHLRDRWADVDLALQATIADASAPVQPRPMPGLEGLGEMAAARERGERSREAAASAPSPFAEFPAVGGGHDPRLVAPPAGPGISADVLGSE